VLFIYFLFNLVILLSFIILLFVLLTKTRNLLMKLLKQEKLSFHA